jgi:hypothetical protein
VRDHFRSGVLPNARRRGPNGFEDHRINFAFRPDRRMCAPQHLKVGEDRRRVIDPR